MHRGLPCSKENVRILDKVDPPSSSATTSFSCGKPPMMTVPTCDDMSIYKYKGFNKDLNLSRLIQVLLLSFTFLLDTI
jgi:hypothetical protein